MNIHKEAIKAQQIIPKPLIIHDLINYSWGEIKCLFSREKVSWPILNSPSALWRAREQGDRASSSFRSLCNMAAPRGRAGSLGCEKSEIKARKSEKKRDKSEKKRDKSEIVLFYLNQDMELQLVFNIVMIFLVVILLAIQCTILVAVCLLFKKFRREKRLDVGTVVVTEDLVGSCDDIEYDEVTNPSYITYDVPRQV